MTYSVSDYIAALKDAPLTLTFEDAMSMIDSHYDFTPTAFDNGSVGNEAGQNSGSCKVFSFAAVNGLTELQALHMFSQHYQNVLDNPQGDNHGNIRAFMRTGFRGLTFHGTALEPKSSA